MITIFFFKGVLALRRKKVLTVNNLDCHLLLEGFYGLILSNLINFEAAKTNKENKERNFNQKVYAAVQ